MIIHPAFLEDLCDAIWTGNMLSLKLQAATDRKTQIVLNAETLCIQNESTDESSAVWVFNMSARPLAHRTHRTPTLLKVWVQGEHVSLVQCWKRAVLFAGT